MSAWSHEARKSSKLSPDPRWRLSRYFPPEDRISRYNGRLADYRRMGIANVWVIDPANQVGYDCSTAAWLPVEEFRIAGSPIFLRLNDLWSELQANR